VHSGGVDLLSGVADVDWDEGVSAASCGLGGSILEG
jgi:hypothetical protein